MEVYKYTARRKVIILICVICASLLLLSSMPTSYRGNSSTRFTRPEIFRQKTFNEGELDGVITRKSTNFVPTSASQQQVLMTTTVTNNLPQLPEANKDISKVNLNIDGDLKSILQVIYSHKLPIFLIEPCILWKILTKDEQYKLISRRSKYKFADECNLTESNLHLYTFGLIDQHDSSIWSLLSESLKSKGFNVNISPNENQINHLLIKSKETLVHVVIFSQRGDMHMAQALGDSTSFAIKSEELRLGQYESAFELITPTAVKINGNYLLIPSNYQRFMFELPHSRFLECRHDLAKKWAAKYSLNSKVENKLNETLAIMRHLIFDVHVPIWMDGGSLLGWARHCSGKKRKNLRNIYNILSRFFLFPFCMH